MHINWLANGAKVGTLLWLGTFIVWNVHGSATTFPNIIVCRVRFARVSCPRLRFEKHYPSAVHTYILHVVNVSLNETGGLPVHGALRVHHRPVRDVLRFVQVWLAKVAAW